MNYQEILEIQDQHCRWLSDNPRCSGTGIQNHNGELCFVIYSNGLTEEDKIAISDRLPGVPVLFDEIGAVEIQ